MACSSNGGIDVCFISIALSSLFSHELQDDLLGMTMPICEEHLFFSLYEYASHKGLDVGSIDKVLDEA